MSSVDVIIGAHYLLFAIGGYFAGSESGRASKLAVLGFVMGLLLGPFGVMLAAVLAGKVRERAES